MQKNIKITNDESIKLANAIDDSYLKSLALSNIDQSLAQSNKVDEFTKTFFMILSRMLIQQMMNIGNRSLNLIIVEKLEVKDNLSKILLAITIHLLNIIYMKCH